MRQLALTPMSGCSLPAACLPTRAAALYHLSVHVRALVSVGQGLVLLREQAAGCTPWADQHVCVGDAGAVCVQQVP